MFDLIIFIAGVIYGYITTGKQDRFKLLKNGLILGASIGVIFGALNLTNKGLAGFGTTFIMSVYWVGILTVLFIGGTIVGDVLEQKIKK
jgi:hypothetical protein